MNKQASITILLALLTSLIGVIFASPSFASPQIKPVKECGKLAALEVNLAIYQCPAQDPRLKQALLPLIHNPQVQRKICNTTSAPSECMSSVFSLQNESTGLHNILNMKQPSHDVCNMANEDNSQLRFYAESYLKKKCV